VKRTWSCIEHAGIYACGYTTGQTLNFGDKGVETQIYTKRERTGGEGNKIKTEGIGKDSI
jgi:hypothetical protein